VCGDNDIKGVPSVKIYYKGSVLVHEGGRDVPSLTQWIKESMENDGMKINPQKNVDL
jgi:hypothetical protein